MQPIRRSGSWLCVLLLLMALAAPAGAVGTTPAAIKVNRTVGPPTTSTLVEGRGFGPTETVDIDFDGSPLATAITDPTGVFQARIQIPASAIPGRHECRPPGRVPG